MGRPFADTLKDNRSHEPIAWNRSRSRSMGADLAVAPGHWYRDPLLTTNGRRATNPSRDLPKEYLAVVCWPDREPEDPCCRLKGDNATWIDLKAADTVLLRQTTQRGRIYWVKRIVGQGLVGRRTDKADGYPGRRSRRGATLRRGIDWFKGDHRINGYRR